MKTIAIIPARGGSKGIPNKNLYPINNQPLITYAIKAIQNSNIDHCYVSTDCSAIKKYSMSLNVSVIDRPKELASDAAPTIECIYHAIDVLNLQDEDIVLTIQATNPFIQKSDINDVLVKLKIYDFAITISEHHKVLWKVKEDTLIPYNHNPESRIRRQDQEKIVFETGSIYGSRVRNIKKYKTLCGINNVGYVNIPKSRSFEIDDYEDVNIVEKLMRD